MKSAMTHHHPELAILGLEYGWLPGVRRLNPRFPAGAAVLRATTRIEWRPGDARSEISRLEGELLAFLPSLALHECRGARAYHVFQGGSGARAPLRAEEARRGDQGNGDEPPDAGERATLPRTPTDDRPFDAALALAHLIEHVAIDIQCGIAGLRRCSGATAALRGRARVFDVILECPDRRAGRLSLALAVSWIGAILAGASPGSREREVLSAAALAYSLDGMLLTAPGVARALAWPQDRAERALATLHHAGYLRATPFCVNISGVPEYRIDAR